MASTHDGNSAARLIKQMEDLSPAEYTSELDRIHLISATQSLLQRLETPPERLREVLLLQPALDTDLKVIVYLQLPVKCHQHGGQPKSASELAVLGGCDPALLRRLLQHLSTAKIVTGLGGDRFGATTMTAALMQNANTATVRFLYDCNFGAMHALPTFLAEKEYINSQLGYSGDRSDSNGNGDGVWQRTKNCPGQTLFEYLAANPTMAEDFNLTMSAFNADRPNWMEVYPTEDLFEGADLYSSKNAVLLVDIGGGLGHDVEKFRARYPDAAGKLVLQDRPEVVAHTVCKPPVKTMAHDFFAPQPILGKVPRVLSPLLSSSLSGRRWTY